MAGDDAVGVCVHAEGDAVGAVAHDADAGELGGGALVGVPKAALEVGDEVSAKSEILYR